MIEIGRICVKIAGRDAGKYCVIIDVLDNTFVLIDGQTRRRKCNIIHLEPTAKKIDIAKSASEKEVSDALAKENITVTQSKSKKPADKPKKQRKTAEELRKARLDKKQQKQSESKKQKVEKKAEKPAGAPESLEEKAGLTESKEEKPAKKAEPSSKDKKPEEKK